jgi:SAM-dependent methyltransferase
MKTKVTHTPKEPQPPDTSLGAYYPYFEHIARTLVKYFRIHTALDIGCNTGALVKAFRDLAIEAYGVDVAEAAISNAPRELRGQLYCLDVTRDRLPFEDENLDFITMLDTLEHLPHFEWTVCEIKRTLKAGACIYISTPSKITETVTRMTLHRHDSSHINVQSRQFWIRLFESYGLKYLCDFPKLERKKALTALSRSKPFLNLILKVYSIPFIPDFRSDLIFQKRL